MYETTTAKHLNDYGEVGLRTLALAYKKLDESEYSAWNDEFVKAKTSISADREAMLELVADMMEKDLILIGATAVEDKLQKGVHDMIVLRDMIKMSHFVLFLLISFFFLSRYPSA